MQNKFEPKPIMEYDINQITKFGTEVYAGLQDAKYNPNSNVSKIAEIIIHQGIIAQDVINQNAIENGTQVPNNINSITANLIACCMIEEGWNFEQALERLYVAGNFDFFLEADFELHRSLRERRKTLHPDLNL